MQSLLTYLMSASISNTMEIDMFDISWPPRDLNAVSAVEWAEAFAEAHPEAAPLTLSLANWFLSALRAGYKAGMSHAEYPEA